MMRFLDDGVEERDRFFFHEPRDTSSRVCAASQRSAQWHPTCIGAQLGLVTRSLFPDQLTRALCANIAETLRPLKLV